MGLKCWWFGCEGHPEDPAPPEHLHCAHCDQLLSYQDLAGDTRHNRFKEWVGYWFWRRWMPEKCRDCGKRYGKHEQCLPF